MTALKAVVSTVIVTLLGVSFLPREAAARLIPLQKFLTKEIERRRP
ncbi:hypothetical protein [Falsirhodobacter halotolerans]|nr:hypothetical protein [Falsirhodobacter halotolerans]MCJ8138416.1 hypothetical protein [Falsirhodobacter halotolerans]